MLKLAVVLFLYKKKEREIRSSLAIKYLNNIRKIKVYHSNRETLLIEYNIIFNNIIIQILNKVG